MNIVKIQVGAISDKYDGGVMHKKNSKWYNYSKTFEGNKLTNEEKDGYFELILDEKGYITGVQHDDNPDGEVPEVKEGFEDAKVEPEKKKVPSFINEEPAKVKSEDSYYLETRKVEVKADKLFNGMKYASWSTVWDIAKRIDSECNYEVHEFEGKPYMVSLKSVMVKVSVKFSEVTHSIWLPVMDNKHKAKDVDQVDSRDISDTIMRALVKCLAFHGVGLSMYAKDGLPSDD